MIGENSKMTARGLVLALLANVMLILPTAQALEVDPVAEAKRLEAGFARLCGVWEWTVHSHTLSHREGKSQIVLPSPEAAGVQGPSPSEIRIYGDAVYLRWDFKGGYQEDSLLLSDNRRLEGTFRTSYGAVGAITGKRVSSCKPSGADGKP
jgi:hypothetical protein